MWFIANCTIFKLNNDMATRKVTRRKTATRTTSARGRRLGSLSRSYSVAFSWAIVKDDEEIINSDTISSSAITAFGELHDMIKSYNVVPGSAKVKGRIMEFEDYGDSIAYNDYYDFPFKNASAPMGTIKPFLRKLNEWAQNYINMAKNGE